MLYWACELVVNRTVMIYAPELYERLGPYLGPVQLFAEQDRLWRAASLALGALDWEDPMALYEFVSFHRGDLRMQQAGESQFSRLRQWLVFRVQYCQARSYTSHNGRATLLWPLPRSEFRW